MYFFLRKIRNFKNLTPNYNHFFLMKQDLFSKLFVGTLSPQNTEIISDIRVIHNFVKYDFLQIFKKISKEICSWVKEKYFTVLACTTYIFILFEKSKGTIWDFIWFSKHISIWKNLQIVLRATLVVKLIKNRKVPIAT